MIKSNQTIDPNKIRLTKQRKLIYKIIGSTNGHLTAEAVYNIARTKKNDLSLGTVYRNLNFLVSAGLINEVSHAGISYFEGLIDSHYHFLCNSCNRVYNIDMLTEVSSILENIELNHKIVNYKINFSGTCQECK